MIRRVITYAATALLAALYWGLAGSICYRLTGIDPREIPHATPGSAAAAAAILVLFVIVFALIGHRLERRHRDRVGLDRG